MRWTVGPGDGRTVGEVLARAGADANAVSGGRVFVGPRRVRGAHEAVSMGDVVSVAAPHAQREETVTILVNAGDLVAVDKPAGIPTIPDHGGAAHSLSAAVARTLGLDAARLHATSRLDRDVSGVVVFALTKAAAERLSTARAEGAYQRRYVALAARAPVVEQGTWKVAIGRARDARLRAPNGRDAARAATHFRVVSRSPRGEVMLALSPETGRTHQIRVHAAHAAAPLLGDRAYGGPPRITLSTGRVLEARRIALHAARVVVPGEGGSPLVAVSPIPVEVASLWSALGGDAAAWEVSTSCALP